MFLYTNKSLLAPFSKKKQMSIAYNLIYDEVELKLLFHELSKSERDFFENFSKKKLQRNC